MIEFWLENQVLIELLPPEIVNQYLKFMEPQALQELARAIAASSYDLILE